MTFSTPDPAGAHQTSLLACGTGCHSSRRLPLPGILLCASHLHFPPVSPNVSSQCLFLAQTLKKENVGGRDGEKRLAVNGPKSLPWKRLEPPANSVCCDVGLGGWQACPRPATRVGAVTRLCLPSETALAVSFPPPIWAPGGRPAADAPGPPAEPSSGPGRWRFLSRLHLRGEGAQPSPTNFRTCFSHSNDLQPAFPLPPPLPPALCYNCPRASLSEPACVSELLPTLSLPFHHTQFSSNATSSVKPSLILRQEASALLEH